MRSATDIHGGLELRRRPRIEWLKRWCCLHELSALLLRLQPVLLYAFRMQRKTETASAARPPQEDIQAVGTNLGEVVRVGARGGVTVSFINGNVFVVGSVDVGLTLITRQPIGSISR